MSLHRRQRGCAGESKGCVVGINDLLGGVDRKEKQRGKEERPSKRICDQVKYARLGVYGHVYTFDLRVVENYQLQKNLMRGAKEWKEVKSVMRRKTLREGGGRPRTLCACQTSQVRQFDKK